MNKDSKTIFESYKRILEQSETEMELNQIIDILLLLIQKDPTKSIQGKDLTKLIQFLGQPNMLESYKSFQITPMKMQSSPVAGDASTVNMGKGGTLEVQPDGQYPR
jgi:hypothetical protein